MADDLKPVSHLSETIIDSGSLYKELRARDDLSIYLDNHQVELSPREEADAVFSYIEKIEELILQEWTELMDESVREVTMKRKEVRASGTGTI